MKLEKLLKSVKEASRELQYCEDLKINKALRELADLLSQNSELILLSNQKDLAKIDPTDPIYDRILLDENRIEKMAQSLRVIASYDSPIGTILEEKTLENGLELKKISVPLGVIGIIFEARPNVIVDVFGLCFKSKNACVMKGGNQSEKTNTAIMQLISAVLKEHDLLNCAVLLPNDRELVKEIMTANKYIDVIIPRGSEALIRFVRDNSTVPVIETGAGVVHIYLDKDGDIEKGKNIIFNAKVSRPSVCNAMDTLLIHEFRVIDLPELCQPLIQKNVEIFADKKSYAALAGNYPKKLLKKAQTKNFGKEYLSLKMSIKTVASFDEAVSHIENYGTKHSEAIVTQDQKVAEKFLSAVDAAIVYANASTRFTDGEVFGLGAEIGISTQKLHARGPMGIKELTSYKWLIKGDGTVR